MRRSIYLKMKDPIKKAAIDALKRTVDPLVAFMFDTGITVQEFGRLVRDRAVRSAAARVAKESGRVNNSRVAIITGLARAEVARVLSSNERSLDSGIGQHPARKILAAWHDNQSFLDTNGNPSVLPIFGIRKSFEKLVERFGGGCPVRAMLDQLHEIGAVDILSGQRVRVRSRVPIFRGMTTSAITNFGERAGDLLATLRTNLHTAEEPLFEGTASVSEADPAVMPLVRRQIAEQGAAFIDSAGSLLNRSREKSNNPGSRETRRPRMGVTVFYFEDGIANDSSEVAQTARRRKNLQRRIDKQKIAHK
jgi:Family of unknown function (DUF6502)